MMAITRIHLLSLSLSVSLSLQLSVLHHNPEQITTKTTTTMKKAVFEKNHLAQRNQIDIATVCICY